MRLAVCLIALLAIIPVRAEWQNLWPVPAPGAPQPSAGSETTNGHGNMSQIEIPQ